MDVQCERCQTEYEFDDALVSGRGTTVRCTNCGHQFKVRRGDSEASGAQEQRDEWAVTTRGGQRLTFLSLRELQRAILAKQVGRADMLAHGGGSARALASIAELEPFFEGRASSRPPPAPEAGTQRGSGARPVPGPPRVPRPAAPAEFPKRTVGWNPEALPAARPKRDSYGPLPDLTPPPRKIDTLRPPAVGPATPPPPAPLPPTMAATPAVGAAHSAAALAATVPALTAAAPAPYPPPPLAPAALAETPLPPPTVPVRHTMPSGGEEWNETHGATPSIDETYAVPRRRRVGGWIVALVLLGAVGVVGWVVAKPYVQARSAGAASQIDPRAQQFLADGEKALADGDLDGAQAAFDKASALAEHDPRVALDEARVAAAKADVPWLRLKMLPPDAVNEVRAAKAQIDSRVAAARKAADEAANAASQDPVATRAKIDALRLAGERDAARALVSKTAAIASQPETAYVLAALDLAEAEPIWTTVIDRLRLAAASEGGSGRARAALVYTLARSGDAAAAKAELAKLDASARPHPLLPDLHAFVEKAPIKIVAVASASAPPKSVDVSALPQAGGAGGAGATSAAGGDAPEDPRGAMQQAQAAIRKGDWGRARGIYEGMVARNPSDSEALSGIGDVARAQGDSAGAVAAYKRALSVNPSYLPALLGVGDTAWAGGDKASATRMYKEIVDRFPPGTYPAYVKTRAEGPAPPPASAAPSAAPPPPPTPAPSAAPTPATAPTPTRDDGI